MLDASFYQLGCKGFINTTLGTFAMHGLIAERVCGSLDYI